jgi:hypothetical protein
LVAGVCLQWFVPKTTLAAVKPAKASPGHNL